MKESGQLYAPAALPPGKQPRYPLDRRLYNTVQSVERQPTFRRNISPPSSGSNNKPSKKAAESMWQAEPLLALLAWSIFRPRRWRRHVPPKSRLTFNGLHSVISQDRTLHNHRCENFKSYINFLCSSHFSHVSYRHCPSHPTYCDLSNICFRVQIIKLLLQLSPSSCYCI
jgi:hypothetical protein